MTKKLLLAIASLAVICGLLVVAVGGCTGTQGGATPGDAFIPDTPSDATHTPNDTARQSVTFTLNLANDADPTAEVSARGLSRRVDPATGLPIEPTLTESPWYAADQLDLISVEQGGVRLGNDCVGDDGSTRSFNVFVMNETSSMSMLNTQVEVLSCSAGVAHDGPWSYGDVRKGQDGPGQSWNVLEPSERAWSFSYTGSLNLEATPSPSTVDLNGTAQLAATPKDSLGRVVLTAATMAWSSETEAVASVNADGVVTGMAGGSAIINVQESESGVRGTGVVHVPTLSVATTSLDFETVPTSMTFLVTNVGAGDLTFSCTASESWVSLDPASGTGEKGVTITVDRTAAPAGENTAEVSVTSNGGGATIGLRMDVPRVVVDTSSLHFATDETTKSFSLSNTGSGTLAWTATPSNGWLQLNKTGGTGASSITVTLDRSQLPPGNASGSIAISSYGGDTSVAVSAVNPGLSVTPASLDFGTATPSLQLTISNSGTGDLHWTCSESADWITSLSSTSGTNGGVVTVTVDRMALVPGPYSSEITFISNGGDETIPVDIERNTGGVDVVID